MPIIMDIFVLEKTTNNMKKIFTIIALVLVCLTSTAQNIDYSPIDDILSTLITENPVSDKIYKVKIDTTIVIDNSPVKIEALKEYYPSHTDLLIGVRSEETKNIKHVYELGLNLGFENRIRYADGAKSILLSKTTEIIRKTEHYYSPTDDWELNRQIARIRRLEIQSRSIRVVGRYGIPYRIYRRY